MSRDQRARERRIRALRATLPLLAGCTDRELRVVDALGVQIEIRPGRTLTTEGAAGREVVVLSGSAVATHDGTVVGTIEAGSVVGEISLLDGTTRTATVVARTPMRVLVLDPGEFGDLLASVPTVERALRRLADDRRRATAGAVA